MSMLQGQLRMSELSAEQLRRQIETRELDKLSRSQGKPERFSRLALSDVFTMFGAPTGSSELPMGMRVVPGSLAAIGAIAELPFNFGISGFNKAFDTDIPVPTMFMDSLTENRRQALRNAGTGEPKTTEENIFSVLTGFLPGPKIQKATTSLNKAQKVLTNLLFPLVQSRSVPGAALEMGAAFLPVEVMNELIDPEFKSAIIEGVFDDAESSSPNDEPEVSLAPTFLDGPIQIETPESFFDPGGVLPLNDEAGEQTLEFSSLMGLALAASIASTKRGRRGIGELPGLTGQRAGREQVTPVSVQIVTEIANRHAPLESAVEIANPSSFQRFYDILKTSATPTAVASKVKAALYGALPNTHINIPSLVIHASTIAKMRPQEIADYSDVLTAMDKLDDLNARNSDVWQGATRDIDRKELSQIVRNGLENPLIRGMVDEAHGMMRGLRDYAFDSGMITRAEFELWRDTHSNYVPQAFDFNNAKRGPMSSILDKVINLTNDQPVAKSTTDFVKKRTGQIGPDEGLPPFMLFEQRISSAVHAIEQNRVRREFFQAMDGTELGGKTIKEVGSSNALTITFMENGIARHMQVGDDAIRRALEFAPRQVAGILNQARQFTQMMLTRQGNPAFVGIAWAYELSLAPMMRRPGRNLGIGDELLQRAGLPTISNIGDRFGNFFSDPTVLLSPITGGARTVYADMMRGLWRNMETSYRVNGTVARALGPKMTRRLSKIGMQAYENSFAHMADQFGAGNAVYASNRLSDDLPTQLNKLAPDYFAAAEGIGLAKRVTLQIWNAYSHVLSQLHNVNRLQHFAANVTPSSREVLATVRERGIGNAAERALFEEALDQTRGAAAETRRMAIDPGQVGANVSLQRTTSMLRYSDIAIQATAEWARTFRKHPVRTSMAISGTMFALGTAQYMSFRSNPRAADHYYNKLTPAQRASAVYFYKPNTDEVFFTFPIDHLHRPIWSPFTEMLGAVSGIRAGIKPIDAETALMQEGIFDFFANATFDEETSESIKMGFEQSVLMNAPIDVPAAVGAPVAVGFGQQFNVGRGGQFVTNIRQSNIDPDQKGATVGAVVSAETEAALQDIFGAAMSPLLDTMKAFNIQMGTDEGFDKALGVAWERLVASSVGSTRLLPSMFGLDVKILTSDPAASLLAAKVEGIKNIRQRSTTQLKRLGGANRTGGQLPSGLTAEPAVNTALGFVLGQMDQVQSELLSDVNEEVTRLFQELEDFRRNPDFQNPRQLREIENIIAIQIKNARLTGVERLQDREAAITKQLRAFGWSGTFSLQNFDDDMANELIKIPAR